MPAWIRAWLVFLKGLQRRPEDSASFRQWVGVNVTVALIATASQLEWPFFVWPCLLLTWLGMWLSHRLRYRNNWEIKAALSIFMIVALGNFFVGLSRSYYDPREPLAELLMWLQALHSCDLPTRKDLNYSLLSALALMSVAGVLTLNLGFAFYLVAYFVTTVAALRHNVSSLISERTGWQVERGRFEWRGAAKMGGYTLAFGTVIIFCMPRLEGFRIRALPMNWQNRLGGNSSNGNVLNPYYPSQLSKEQLLRAKPERALLLSSLPRAQVQPQIVGWEATRIIINDALERTLYQQRPVDAELTQAQATSAKLIRSLQGKN